jgi:hypothetical protein
MKQEEYRRRLVQATLQFTQGTTLAAGAYECQLLEQFVTGQLTIEEVVALLEAPAGRWPLAA